MEAVNIHIGPLAFDHADYDPDGDVLYLHRGAPQPAEGEETPEGHVLRFAPGTDTIVGLTIVNVRWLLDRDGRLVVTICETVEVNAAELSPGLARADGRLALSRDSEPTMEEVHRDQATRPMSAAEFDRHLGDRLSDGEG